MTHTVMMGVALIYLLGTAQQPKDPASIGYKVITAPSPPLDCAYSTIPPVPGSADENWLSTQQARIAQIYGAVADYTKDLSLTAVKASLQRATLALHNSSTFKTANAELMRASLEEELKQTTLSIVTLSGQAVPATFGASLDPMPLVNAPMPGRASIDSDIAFFVGTDRQVLFRTTTHGDATQPALYYATPEEALEFSEVAKRIFAIASTVRGSILKELGTRLTELNKAWDNCLVKGYSQFPWESYVNGYVTPLFFGKPSWYDPPHSQLVFLHPEVGVLADLRSRSTADVQSSLFVDALGYIHYFGDDRDWFFGASLAASFSDDSVGLGLGPMFHFGNSGQGSQLPNVSLGLFWVRPEDGRDGVLIGIGIDLWRLFDKTGPEGVLQAAIPGLTQ